MTREEIEACWNDRRNWKWVGIYFCKADPRVIVPKHRKWMGWTLNFARPSAVPTLLLILAFVIVPLRMVERRGVGTVRLTLAAEVLVLCLVCAYSSSRTE
ncbi:MAG TPA: DUF5808 domain-containing protein [Verrucomicrobiae bacterium]|nr:DUF5808 domain-containing protein [Verrucomicrobiae bacterium]